MLDDLILDMPDGKYFIRYSRLNNQKSWSGYIEMKRSIVSSSFVFRRCDGRLFDFEYFERVLSPRLYRIELIEPCENLD